MILLKLLYLTLTFYEVILHSDARICPKGQRVSLVRGQTSSCEDCHSGSYQPEESDSQECKACTNCDQESGSVVIQKCTKELDTKCQCSGDFVPSDIDSSTCKCDIGFGLNKRGECLKCEDGYFSTSINSPCQKWKDLPSQSSPGVAQSEADTTTTLSPLTNFAIPKNTVKPPNHSNPGKQIGILLISGIIGILLLYAVYCKLHTIHHMEGQPAAQKNDSLCRRPVEESGDGSLSSLKVNEVEP